MVRITITIHADGAVHVDSTPGDDLPSVREVPIMEPSPVRTELHWSALLRMWAADAAVSGRNEAGVAAHVARVNWFMEFSGLDDFRRVRPEHVIEWRAELAARGQPAPSGRRRPSGASAQAQHLGAMRSYWAWLQRMEAVPGGPCPFDAVTAPSRPAKTCRAFTAVEVSRLIEVADEDEAGDPETWRASLYRVLSAVGVRVGTAARVRWRDLELDREPAILVVLPNAGKERRERRLTLPPAARASILAVRDATDPEPPDHVWGRLPDRVLHEDCRSAGVPVEDARGRHVGWHCFRRFVASQLAADGVSPKVAQLVLGHASVQTTLRHYVDVADPQISDALKRVTAKVYESGTKKAIENRKCGLDPPDAGREDTGERSHDQPHDQGQPEPPEPGRSISRVWSVGRFAHGGRVTHPPDQTAEPPIMAHTGSSPVSPIIAANPDRRLLDAYQKLVEAQANLIGVLTRPPEGGLDGTRVGQPGSSTGRTVDRPDVRNRADGGAPWKSA